MERLFSSRLWTLAVIAAAPLFIAWSVWLTVSSSGRAEELFRSRDLVIGVIAAQHALNEVEEAALATVDDGATAEEELEWERALQDYAAEAAELRASEWTTTPVLEALEQADAAVERISEARARLPESASEGATASAIAEIKGESAAAVRILAPMGDRLRERAATLRDELGERRKHLVALVALSSVFASALALVANLHRKNLAHRERAEQELRESEALFRQLAESLDQVVWVSTATKEQYLYMGPAFERIWGRPRNTLIDDPSSLLRMVAPEDRARVGEAVARQKRGEVVDVEYRMLRPDGEVRWIRTRAAPIFNERGEFHRIGGLAEDVTERRLAEAALRLSEERFRTAIDNFPYSFVIYDSHRRLQFVNARGVELTGRAEEELLGRRDEEIFPAEFTSGYLPALIRAAETGESQMTECSVVTPDGHRTMVVHHIPLKDEEGRVHQILGVTHDMTERVRAESALRESEERFKAFMDNSPTVAFLKDESGRYVYVNKLLQSTFIHLNTDWLGKTDAEIWPAEEAKQFRSNDLAVLDANRPLEIVEIVATPHGGRGHWLVFKFPIIDGARRRFVGGVGVDITAQRLAEDRMRWLNRELDHRVKNNLAVVAALAEQTASHATGLPEFREAFLGRLQAMSRVHALIALGRWREASLPQVIRDCLAPFADEARLTVRGADVTLAAKQASSIGMVVNELATNAAKHGAWSTPLGRVSVEWSIVDSAPGQRLELRWEESGGPPATQPEREGFGSQLIRQVVAFDLGGAVSLEYLSTGLRCLISVSLSHHEGEGEEGGVGDGLTAAVG